jgi:hypothetical protein
MLELERFEIEEGDTLRVSLFFSYLGYGSHVSRFG